MNVSVYSPRDWVVLMRQIKSEKCHHKWEAARSSFWQAEGYSQHFSNFHKDENGTPVSNWKKVQVLMVRESDPYILFFKKWV